MGKCDMTAGRLMPLRILYLHYARAQWRFYLGISGSQVCQHSTQLTGDNDSSARYMYVLSKLFSVFTAMLYRWKLCNVNVTNSFALPQCLRLELQKDMPWISCTQPHEMTMLSIPTTWRQSNDGTNNDVTAPHCIQDKSATASVQIHRRGWCVTYAIKTLSKRKFFSADKVILYQPHHSPTMNVKWHATLTKGIGSPVT